MEKTFVLFKPDTLQRSLLGEALSRFEKKGLKLVAAKLITLDDAMLETHYAHHKAKPFFPRLVKFMQSAPVLATVWEGKDAVEVVRQMAGPTNGRLALPGTIRGDLSVSTQCNLVHASDSPASGEREAALFFRPEEIIPWQRDVDRWIIE